MAHGREPVAAPAVTYTERKLTGPTVTCKRCARVHAYPRPDDKPIRCECGWWYRNVGGEIVEEFRPRLGAA
ncbi:MAG TPA: hypothetical protein VGZ00_06200 [Candidatus Baltobacteraceae bacterium]|nr:hypothetical protein [Candidatus Baltobacteraceae bacterium]